MFSVSSWPFRDDHIDGDFWSSLVLLENPPGGGFVYKRGNG